MEWSVLVSSGEIPAERYGHCAVSVDNSIYVIGGKTSSRRPGFRSGSNGIEMYCLKATNGQGLKWQSVHYEGHAPRVRWAMSCCYVAPLHCIAFYGGFDSECNYGDFQLFDISNSRWQNPCFVAGSRLPSARAYTAMAVQDTTVFLFGGMCCVGGPYDYYNELWEFELGDKGRHARRIETTGVKIKPRSQCSMFIHGNHLYVFGGLVSGEDRVAEIYRTKIDEWHWTAIDPGGSPRPSETFGSEQRDFRVNSCRHEGVLVGNNWYLLHGVAEDAAPRRCLLYKLDLKTIKWSLAAKDGPELRGNSTFTLLRDSNGTCMLVTVGGHRHVMRGEGDEHRMINVNFVTVPSKWPWDLERLLWLATLKNDSDDCPLARLPPHLVLYVRNLLQAPFAAAHGFHLPFHV